MPWRPRGPGDDERDSRDLPRYRLTLERLPGRYAVCRLPYEAGQIVAPEWAAGEFAALVSSRREAQPLTVVAEESRVPPEGVEADRGWHVLKFAGTFGFGEVGVLASVLNPLVRAGVPALCVSSFETDYVLVKAGRWDRVGQVLVEAGHEVRD